MTHSEITHWLKQTDPTALAELWQKADALRRCCVGDGVYLRGIVELSNYCVRECHYCGLRAQNGAVDRYRLTMDDALLAVDRAVSYGFGTVVLQAGEDPALTGEWVAELIARIKQKGDIAVTLSLGERTCGDLTRWRQAGADRYLLRFETSDPRLLRRIHPSRSGFPVDRLSQLHKLRSLGYEVGSGVMVGIPGQSYETLAADIELFRELDLDMIGVGPYLPHPDTPMGRDVSSQKLPEGDQVEADVLTTCKVVALARLICPFVNIPSTTALNVLDPNGGHELALSRGANVIMPNVTPMDHRRKYQVYPAKGEVGEDGEEAGVKAIKRRIIEAGRIVADGRGDSQAYIGRNGDDAEAIGRRVS